MAIGTIMINTSVITGPIIIETFNNEHKITYMNVRNIIEIKPCKGPAIC